ncbi:MAG: excinuclease ABC subunit UvrC [Anaerolineae bacterium]|nr:excinuclease ABC subunit UvrC [Anaerolineae bacterium]
MSERQLPELITEKLKNLPTKPGNYLYRDAAGKVIYVGKAVNLRNRVRSYFQAGADHDPKTQVLVQNIADLEWIERDTELEALIHEATLIKQYKPRFNIRLKDDKRYPYIKVSWNEDFPTATLTRRIEQDGARYYGPYTAAWAVYRTLDTLRKVFPYLTCSRVITGKDPRACLYYDIGLCLGPCIGVVNKAQYRAMIERMCRFLEGKSEDILVDLRRQMEAAAENLEFEKAAKFRDQITALQQIVERQKIGVSELVDQDVIALARDNGSAVVQVYFIRGGQLVGREYFLLEGAEGEVNPEVLSSFITQFYEEVPYVPPIILTQEQVVEATIIESWLKTRRGDKVTISVPENGQNGELVKMAAGQATETLGVLKAQWQADQGKQVTALSELQDALGLASPPNRIECYDISNIQGTNSVGAMVVFVQGVPRKSEYRKFRIQTVQGPNDFASLQEVLSRRFKHLKEPPAEDRRDPRRKDEVDPFSLTPDLVIIDGGKGQLNAALEVWQALGLDHIPVVSLAKRQEEIFVPGRDESIILPRDAQSLYLVQRIRDEAHRFGLNYHRTLRSKTGLVSTLEEIKGIGPRRRKTLLQRFGSLDGIRAASLEELAAAPGMNADIARQVKEALGG